jgi:hypothetical protein
MDARQVSGERKAALALSSLVEADRTWMLERLQEPQRARLVALLDELGTMRVSFDRELLKQLGEPEKPQQAEKPLQPPMEAHALETADPRPLLDVLEREPDWLVALVLRARAWPWRGALLERLDTERARRVARVPPDAPALRPKAVAALLDALEAKVRGQPAAQPEHPASFWRRRLAWRR